MEDRTASIIAVIAVFQGLSIIAISVRMYTRKYIVKLIGWDDIFIVVTMIPALTLSTFELMCALNGVGRHTKDVPLENLTTALMFLAISGTPYNLTHLALKASYLALYLRILPIRKYRVVVYCLIATVVVLGVSTAITTVFTCTPIPKAWIPTMDGHCIDIKGYLVSAAVLNMFFDVVVFVLPLPFLQHIKLTGRQRLVLAGTFACGSIVLVASAVRVYTLFQVTYSDKGTDPMWETIPVVIWSEIEVHLAIILSCIPAFKSLASRFFPGLMGSLHTKSANSYALQSRMRNRSVANNVDEDGNPSDTAGTGFRTIIKSTPRNAESLDSEEGIVTNERTGQGTTGGGGWPTLQTTISIHSSSRESLDGGGGKYVAE